MAHIGICNTCRNAEAERKDKQSWIIIFFRGPYTVRSLARYREISMGLDHRSNMRSTLFIAVITSFVLTGCGGSGNGGATPAQNTGGGAPQVTAPETTVTTSPNSPVTNQTSATFEFSSNDPNTSFEVSLNGSGFVPATSPHTVDGLTDGTHTIAFRAVDDAGTPDPTPESATWTVDTQPPEIEVSETPQPKTSATDASFAFSSDSDTTFEGSLDGGEFESISSPFSTSGLTVGSHTLEIRATDSASNSESTTYSWEVIAPTGDTPPDTFLTTNTPELNNANSATFAFSSNESGVIFSGRIDGEAFTEITGPHTVDGLDDGAHTFEVSAIDPSGNADPTPASFTWTVDTTPPDTALNSAPQSPTNQLSATFEFTATEPNSAFEGRLNGEPFQIVPTPLTIDSIREGQNTFDVRAVDQAGNPDPMPISFSWTVDATAPQAEITFPTAVSMTDADQLSVTGTATDANGISAVRVNGVDATSDDGFTTWRAVVSISTGDNDLVVETEDLAGNVDDSSATATVKGSPNLFVNPDRIALDPTNNGALVVDGVNVVALNLNNGARTIVASESVGSGPVLGNPRGIAVGSEDNSVLVTDAQLDALVRIDLDDNSRSIVSDSITGLGENFGFPRGLALDLTSEKAYVIDSGLRALISVDLNTGDRTEISGNSEGDGTNFIIPVDVALDMNNSRALVTDVFFSDQVIAVNLETGDRSLFTGGGVGSGQSLVAALRIAVDTINNRALVSDSLLDAIIAIDLTDGDRAIFSDASDSGPQLNNPRGLTVELATGRLFIADDGLNTVLAANPTTGIRTRVSNDGIGTGPTIGVIEDFSLDANNNRLITLRSEPFELHAVDLATSQRAFLVDNSVGSGAQIESATRITLSPVTNHVVLLGVNAADAAPRPATLFEIDLPLAARRAIFSGFAAIGQGFGDVADPDVALDNGRILTFVPFITVDPVEPSIVTASLDALVAVDVATGVATEVSGQSKGEGPFIEESSTSGLVPDASLGRVLATDSSTGDLVSFNLEDGARQILSSANAGIGNGPTLVQPDGITLSVGADQAYISDSNLNSVFAVELTGTTAGNRRLISGEGTGSGPQLVSMRGINAHPDKEIIFIYDIENNAIMALDPVSGDRIIVSR